MRRTMPARAGTRVPGLLITALCGLLVLSGCVSIPTSGKVEQVEQGTATQQDRSEVIPKPPLVNAAPRLIIEGFLLAMTRYEPNYAVARQFLSADKREAWRPEDRVTIFDNRKLTTTDTSATLTASRTGELGADGAYRASTGTVALDFRMVKENGQWRISNPPDGLLISQESFSTSFSPFNLYFFDPQFRTLVPDPIYLPTESRIEASLVRALLAGPSTFLRTAVTTAFPPKSTLNASSVPVVDGLAQVSLSDTILGLNDEQRSNLVAQLTWTLRQVQSIRGIQIVAGNEAFSTRDQLTAGNETFVPIDAGTQKGPILPQTSTSLIGLTDNGLVTVDESADQVALKPVPGPFGKNTYRADSVALSVSGQSVAAVTDGGTVLRRGPLADTAPVTLLKDATQLLRPQFTRYDELWEIGRVDGKPTLWQIEDRKVTVLHPDWLDQLQVTAFRLSPDASRIAVVGRRNGASVLGLATITRGDRLAIGELQQIPLIDSSTAALREVADVGWISPTRLLVLASPGSDAAAEPYEVEQDASLVDRVGSSNDWQATSLATSADLSGTTFRAVVAGARSLTWHYRTGDLWPFFSDKLRAPSYPG